MKAFWDERYNENEYAYGCKPNHFLEQNLSLVPKGKILFPAEGQGRNAVFAAQHGFKVFAFDISDTGRLRAEQLADEHSVSIDYRLGSLSELNYPENSFDAIVLIYAHVPAEIRKEFHQHLIRLLKPNGIIIFEAFSKEQLNYTSGGPKSLDMLFSEEEVKNEFSGMDFELLNTQLIHLNEGKYHQGEGSVVRFIARKK